MSITTRAELKTAMAAWLHRGDDGKFNDLIALAEQNILRELKLRINEATVSGTTAGATIAFPAAWGRIERVEITCGSTRYTLDYTSPNGIETLTVSTGLPSRYTVEGGAIRLISAPASAYSYTVFYIPNLVALAADGDSNWALLNAPDVYLYGACAQFGLYSQDNELFQTYQNLFQGAIDEVKRIDQGRRFPISGGLQIKPRNAR